MTEIFDLINLVKQLRSDRRAVTALEYGLIAGGIAVAIVASVNTLGTTLAGMFGAVSSGI